MTGKTTPIQAEERQERIQRLHRMMDTQNIDATIITPGSNMRYFFGLGWRESERLVAALVQPASTTFICPKFEDSALYSHLKGDFEYIFWEEHENPHAIFAVLCQDKKLSAIALDPNCSFGHANDLQMAIPRIPMSNAHTLIAQLRACKSEHELSLLQTAKNITLSVHMEIFKWLRPGVRTSEVIREIDHLHRQKGADNGSTFCAVQFGEGTAHPHGVPGDPKLRADDIVLIDTGCQTDGYNSDITRTYALNKQSPEVERIWSIEKDAQAAAFNAATLGSSCESVDIAARNILRANGLGPEYRLPGLPHRTGHGIGLDIHEGPYLVLGDKTPLAPGMCFSNEPMIVVPDAYGVRLEDHFYMTDTGPVWFTEPQHSLYHPFS